MNTQFRSYTDILQHCTWIVVCPVNTGDGKGIGKAIPVQAWTGREGSRRLRLPDFKTVGT